MKIRPLAGCVALLLTAQGAWALPPVFHTQSCSVSVDNNRLDTVLTPGGADQRNTFAYEPSRKLWHFWGFLQDDPSFDTPPYIPTVLSSLRAVVHATSSDGVHFTSDSNLSYAFGSASYGSYGADIDPPLDFFRAVFDTQTGTWKLFNWTENDQNATPSFGQYNYNTSVNDLSTSASTTNVVHQGPLNTPVKGNHVGAFGLVDGVLFLRTDTDGNADQFAYTDGAYPWTGANQPSTGSAIGSADLFAGTPYCWGLSCGTSNPAAAYVHNVGRTMRQSDGTLGTYYAFRHWDGSRADQQIWYVESTDNGMNWSAPVGVFANPPGVTIDGAGLGAKGFSDVDLVRNGSRYQLYLSAQDAGGNYVMVAAQGRPSDAIFWNGFDACD